MLDSPSVLTGNGARVVRRPVLGSGFGKTSANGSSGLKFWERLGGGVGTLPLVWGCLRGGGGGVAGFSVPVGGAGGVDSESAAGWLSGVTQSTAAAAASLGQVDALARSQLSWYVLCRSHPPQLSPLSSSPSHSC